jgi:hypothetical protein
VSSSCSWTGSRSTASPVSNTSGFAPAEVSEGTAPAVGVAEPAASDLSILATYTCSRLIEVTTRSACQSLSHGTESYRELVDGLKQVLLRL